MLSGRVDGRSAVGTEKLEPPAAVVGGLDVKSGCTGRDLEPVAVCADGHSIRGAGQPLAVGIVADCDVRGSIAASYVIFRHWHAPSICM